MVDAVRTTSHYRRCERIVLNDRLGRGMLVGRRTPPTLSSRPVFSSTRRCLIPRAVAIRLYNLDGFKAVPFSYAGRTSCSVSVATAPFLSEPVTNSTYSPLGSYRQTTAQRCPFLSPYFGKPFDRTTVPSSSHFIFRFPDTQ